MKSTLTTGRCEVTRILNQQLANFAVLYMKLHHFHWYVKGPSFFTLHGFFEQCYNEAAEIVDELAERILTIGGQPLSTMKSYLENASVAEAEGEESAEQMVKQLNEDFGRIIHELNQGIEKSQEQKDEISADMLLNIAERLEKHNWMLRSFLS